MREFKVSKIQTAEWSQKIKVGDEIKESRIKNLKPNEMGYLQLLISNKMVQLLLQRSRNYSRGYLLNLFYPIQNNIHIRFDGQVPIQIRRSGRNNAEGVELSMSQWYQNLNLILKVGMQILTSPENFTVFGEF
jgi:hypothetical protein